MPRSATIEPTLPQPMMPSVLPKISTPRNLFFSHLPARVEASASGICRASASISVMACSAVVIELPNGVFITMMPRAVAAGISTLSTPMPARPITFSPLAWSSSFDVTLVAERMASPSKPSIAAASFSLSLPRLGWKSTSTPRSLKIWTAAGDSASEIRTRGAMVTSFGSAHPAQHVGKRRHAFGGGMPRLAGHGVRVQQRHAEVVSARKGRDDRGRATLVALGVKHDRRIEIEIAQRRVGPRDARHFVAAVRRQSRRAAFGRIGDRDVAGLVQNVARMRKAQLIHHEGAVADVEPGQKGGFRQCGGVHRKTDVAHECRQPLGERIGEHGAQAGCSSVSLALA